MGATSVLDASGQGNFSCANMTPGPDGGTMADVTLSATLTPKLNAKGKIVAVDVDASNLPNGELDAVYIRANGNGARCLYTFSNYSMSAKGVEAGGDDFDLTDVVVCAAGSGTEPPPPPPEPIEPVSTIGDGCEGVVLVDNNSLDNWALVTAVSLDGNTLAVCNGNDPAIGAQVQCINTCANFEARAESPECAQANLYRGLGDGQMDLEACRPCDLTDLDNPPGSDKNGNPLFYCWEYTNSVVRDPKLSLTEYPTAPGTECVPGTGTDPTYCTLRTAGTLLPHKEAWTTSDETKVFNGCYTTTRTLNGRLYTYTTCY